MFSGELFANDRKYSDSFRSFTAREASNIHFVENKDLVSRSQMTFNIYKYKQFPWFTLFSRKLIFTPTFLLLYYLYTNAPRNYIQ